MVKISDDIETSKKKESQLIIQLREDKNLAKDLKMEYTAMATMFLQDLKGNLNKTSIELDEKVPLGIDIWKEFLNYPIVRKYIQSFKDEQIGNKADAGLMTGDKDAVGIKKAMLANGDKINNSNIILIRVPEKKVWD